MRLITSTTLLVLVSAVVANSADYTWDGATGSSDWAASVLISPGVFQNNWGQTGSNPPVPGTTDNVSFPTNAEVTGTGAAFDVINAGVLDFGYGTLAIYGDNISNSGTLTFAGDGNQLSGYDDTFYITTSATLTGGGEVVLVERNDSAIAGTALTNVDNTIRGTGLINVATLVNQGTLRAEGGALDVASTTVTNTNGTVEIGADGDLYLNQGTITGGNLIGEGGRLVSVNGSGLTDVTVSGTVTLAGGSTGTTTVLTGTITNHGTLTFAGDGNQLSGYDDTFYITTSATLTGGGEVVLVERNDSAIAGTALTNVDNTIRGTGLINVATLVNQGTLRAEGGELAVVSSLDNQGTVEALDSSSATFYDPAVTNNNVDGVLAGGRWRAVSSGGGAVIALRGTPIHEVAADTEVELNGVGSAVQVAGTSIDSTLTTNHGRLLITNGRNFTATSPFSNTGKVTVGTNTTFTAPSVTQITNGELTAGSWHVGQNATLNAGGTSIATNYGDVTLDAGATFSQIDTLTDNRGSFAIINGRSFTPSGPFINRGNLYIGSGSTFSGTAGFTQTESGVLEGAGTYSGNLVNNGLLLPGASTGILTIDGNLTLSEGGLLEIEMGGLTPGSQHDQLVVAGNTTLGGQLDVRIVGDYVPQIGDSLTILTSANVTGKFAALYAPDLATANPDVAIQVTKSATDVQVHFVTPLTDNQFSSNSAVVDWDESGSWSTGIEPDSRNALTIQNPAGVDQHVTVTNGDAFVHRLAVENNGNNTTTLNVTNDRALSATADVTIGQGTVLDLGFPQSISKGHLVSPNVTIGKGARYRGNGSTGPKSKLNAKLAKRNELALKNLPAGSYNHKLKNSGKVQPGHSVGLIEVDGDYEQDADGELEMELESPTSYDRFVITGEAKLGGTLEIILLNFAPAAGDSFDIIDWETVVGTFDAVHLPLLPGGLIWNSAQLYTLGVLSVSGVPGDYNLNGTVDAADYSVWRDMLGQSGTGLAADGNGDHMITQADYAIWRSHFGQTAGSGSSAVTSAAVPEPMTIVMLVAGPSVSGFRRRRRLVP